MTETVLPLNETPIETAVIECRSLSCCYHFRGREIMAVETADLVAGRGEIVGIFGPSGAGKTTLLRLVMGLVRPATGDVYWSGRPLWVPGRLGRYHRKPPRPGFAMPVFQDPTGSLDPRWPVWRSVTEPLMARHHGRRLSRRERRSVAREQLQRIGLSHIDIDARPRQLSLGQCQRVAIARALVARPALLVADEPTSALDVTNAAGIIRLLRRTRDEEGLSIIVVSHDQRMLSVLSDRLLEMRDGCLSPMP